MTNRQQKMYLIKQLSIYTSITSMTRINDYMFTPTVFQPFPVSYIFDNLEKTIKYSMHRISERLNVT